MEDNERNRLINGILRHMERNDLTQVEMAHFLCIQQSTLSGWINGTHGISKKHVERIKSVCHDTIGCDISVNGNGNCVNSHNTIGCDIEAFRSGLIRAIIDADLPPDTLKLVLNVVRNYNHEAK